MRGSGQATRMLRGCGLLTWKTVWQFLKKLNTQLPFDLVVAPLGVYYRAIKIYALTAGCDFICNCQKQEAAPSSSGWLASHGASLPGAARQGPHTRHLLCHKAEQTADALSNGRNFGELGWVKKASPQRSHAVWFHLHDILEMTKLQKWTDHCLPRSRLHDLTLLPPRLRLVRKPPSSRERAEETLTKEHVLWGQQKDAEKYQEAERTAANQAAPLFHILSSSELVQFEKWVCFQFHWFLVLFYYFLPSACLFFSFSFLR